MIPPAAERRRPDAKEWWTYLAAAALAWGLVQYALPSRLPFVLQPVHHDDYSNLARSFPPPKLPTRPVSIAIIAAIGHAGPFVYSVALQLLTVACAAMVLWFVSRLLQRAVTLPAAAWLFAVVFLHPRALEWGRYTGLMTNLLSAAFGLLALLCLEELCREAHFGRRGAILVSLAGLLLLLSGLSKEDYLLPALAFGIWTASRPGPSRRRGVAALAAAVTAAGLLFLYNTRIAPNSFTRIRSSGPYTFAGSPAEFARVFARYFTASRLVLAATVICLAAVAATLRSRPAWRSRVLLLAAIPFLLVVPYAFLPNHVAPYYSMSWLCWLGSLFLVIASEFLATSVRATRSAAGVAAVLVWAIAFQSTRGERNALRDWYSINAARTRRAERALVADRELLASQERVGVLGAEWPGPWTMTNGGYLRRWLNLPNRWVVFAGPASQFFPLDEQPQPESTIDVRPLDEVLDSGELLFVVYDGNGDGVSIRHSGRQTAADLFAAAGAARATRPKTIARLYPQATAAGRRFQTTCDGVSAIAVAGTGFAPSDRILWDGQPLLTTYGSPELLTALVPDALIARPRQAVVSVGHARYSFTVREPR